MPNHPVPTKIKEMRGTVRADRGVGDKEAQFPVPDKLPNPPTILGRYGKQAWKYYGSLLLDAGLFTDGDKLALELLCKAYDRWIESEMEVAKSGTVLISTTTGGLYHNPHLNIANKSFEQIRSLLKEFGLSPAERTRVASLGTNPKDDDLASLLFSGIDE